jgi:hypothetical protein
MKNRRVSAIIIAAMLSCLFSCIFSCLGSFAASACGSRINLAAIEQRIADPNLESDLKQRANALKTKAAAAIEAGHRDEGRGLYYQVMALLGMSDSGPYRCN